MAIPTILNAVAYGYNAKTILTHLSKSHPKLQKPINAALKYGYPAYTVLKKIIDPHSSGDGAEEYMTSEEKLMHRDKQQRLKERAAFATGVAAIPAAGFGIYSALSRAATPGIASAVSAAAPSTPAATTQAITPKPTTPSPAAPSAPGSALSLAPTEEKILDEYPQVLRFVDSHLSRGKTPEETYNLLKSSKAFAPILKNFEELRGTSFADVIKQRMSPQAQEALPLSMKGPTPKKADVVITPFGAGEVHKTHGNNAFVKVNDKLKKVPLSDIEEPKPDLVKAVNDILQIPEIDRSSNVALFAYDPDDKKMFIQFHSGDVYRYNDVDPEEVRMVAEKEAIPITTGENAYGAWSPDDPRSLGAALWKYFISNPKYAKPLKDQPANPNYKKLELKYDYWYPLRKQKKKR